MPSLRTVLSLFALMAVVAVNGFTPVHHKPASTSKSTALSFGFLKELGLEKPDWLPDFGSKKEEPVADADPTDEADVADDAEAPAVEE